MANGEKQDISALKQFIEDDKVYYLERDIYIDSDTSSQANFRGPMFTSYGTKQSIKPFSVDVSTPNPDSVGQEKLYVTQTYHKEDFKNANYPFSDYDYFNLQPSVYEEFTYSNNEHSIIDDFKLINRVSREVFRPGDFDCSIINKQDIERTMNLLSQVDLSHKANSMPNNLSQGEQQRAAIALAVVKNPSMILADEPTSSLDDINCQKILNLLKQHAKSTNAKLIIITHDQRLKSQFNKSIKL